LAQTLLYTEAQQAPFFRSFFDHQLLRETNFLFRLNLRVKISEEAVSKAAVKEVVL
jgi:hypothetical protein